MILAAPRARSSRSSSRAPRTRRRRPRCWRRSRRADAIVIGPSNPIASIGPMLAIPGMREAIAAAAAPVVAVSPFVGGEVLKGPTLEFCRWAGIEPSAAGVAEAYSGLLDGIVADEHVDGLPCLVTDTLHGHARGARAGGARDPGVCGIAARRVAVSGARVALQSPAPVKPPDAHHRHPPDQEPRRRQAAPVDHARQRVAPGARAGDVLRRAGLAAPRRAASTRSWWSRPTTWPSRPPAATACACCTTPTRRASPRPPRSASATRWPSGCERVLLVPGDTPLLDPHEVDAAARAHRPDHDRARPPRHRHQLPAARRRRR